MKNLVLSLLLLLIPTWASAQTYHLTAVHGVTAFNGDLSLSSVHGNATTSRSRMPDLWGWAKAKGWSDAEILSLRHAEGAWHDVFWRGEAGNYNSTNPGHAVNISVPNGRFGVSFPMPFAQGRYTGEGSRFSDYNGNHNYGSTHWYVDHAGWKATRSADRIILRSANWGVDGGYGAWVHHYVIEGMHFDGRRRTAWMPAGTDESAGIAAWDSGEASEISNCYFANFEKDGILLVRGTPVLITACSMFTTSRFGVAIVGSGSVTLVSPSGDESGIALIGSIGGYGRPGSTRLAVFGAKQETSTSAEFRPWKGSSFLYAEGWINATIHGVSYASGWTTPYDFITWKADQTIGNWSSISVSGTHFFGNAPRCLLYEEGANREYRFEGNAWQNTMQSFTWHEREGLKTDWRTIAPVQRAAPAGRLQHVGQDGAADWASARVYDPTGGVGAPTTPPPTTPPPTTTPCTYTTGAWSAWSTCTGGQQTRTRTVTASPAGCTGTAPASSETQACTVAPPTTVKARWDFNHSGTNPLRATTGPNLVQAAGTATISGGLLRNGNGNTRWTATVSDVTTVTLVRFTPTTLNYQMILTGSNGRGLIVVPDGRLLDNTQEGNDITLLPAGSLKVGTATTVAVTLQMARTFTGFGASAGAGNCWQGTLDALELR